MRPDEHKKKRSNQYKKKHGVDQSDKAKNAGKNKKKETPVVVASQGKDDADKAGTKDREHEVTDEPIPQTFRRRTVESNWQRYEDEQPDDDEVISSRGEDFQTLMASTSEALAQFKFDEEKDWCNDSDVLPDFLKVNCAALASQLQCIPLHERLGVPPDFLDANSLERYNSDAQDNRKTYAQNHPASDDAISKPNESTPSTDSQDTRILDDLNDLELDDILSATTTLGQNTDKVEQENLYSSKESNELIDKDSHAHGNLGETRDIASKKLAEHIRYTQDSQSALIKTSTNELSVVEGSTNSKAETEKDPLDFLLELDNTVVATDVKTSGHSKVEDSLDDWLDDILGD